MDKLDIFVTRTIDSGVKPIELGCTPIYDCLFSGNVGLYGAVKVNSVLYGSLDAGDYMPALEEDRESAAAFTARNLRVALAGLARLPSQVHDLSLVTLPCPVSLVKKGALAPELTRLLRAAEPRCAEQVCLVFDRALLALHRKTLQDLLLHVRSLGCKVAVSGYGSEDFPMSVLPYAAPDLLIMEKAKGQRSFPKGMAAYVRFAGGLQIRVLARGVESGQELKQLNDAECAYYTPLPGLRLSGQSMYYEKEWKEVLSERGVTSLADPKK